MTELDPRSDRRSRVTERRKSIIEAAMEMFGLKDYAEVSTREIASRAGVSLRLMYYHFGTKEKLRDAVDAHVLEELAAATQNLQRVPLDDRLGVLLQGAAQVGNRPALNLHLRRMLIDDGERGKRLFNAVIDRLYASFEAPGDPKRYNGNERQHEIAMLSLVLGSILLKPQLDDRYGQDIHAPSEDQARLAVYAPILREALRTTGSTNINGAEPVQRGAQSSDA